MDTLTELATFVSENAIWIGLIMLYPVWVRLGAILRIIIIELFQPKHKIIIRRLHNGVPQNSVEIDLDSKEPLVHQLRTLRDKNV